MINFKAPKESVYPLLSGFSCSRVRIPQHAFEVGTSSRKGYALKLWEEPRNRVSAGTITFPFARLQNLEVGPNIPSLGRLDFSNISSSSFHWQLLLQPGNFSHGGFRYLPTLGRTESSIIIPYLAYQKRWTPAKYSKFRKAASPDFASAAALSEVLCRLHLP
ncbi:hypothetical protein K402DRAFT_228886 [Aulographum hederae CBS 113979]|uniref:Uncharacterized protein n=1 Tax=Aulographum hederae CBS 113979 TaxID=1176131 RepID=A0A6G1HB43_9PEZI|nr:hypothetical protein K402DRAFT_228886 [Aulographum hederae CBS 113979]